MKNKFKEDGCNKVILTIGKFDIKGIAFTDSELNDQVLLSKNIKYYRVDCCNDVKTWSEKLFKRVKPKREMQYRAIRKLLYKVYEDTSINKFAICYEDLENVTPPLLASGDVFLVKKLFKKIELELVEVNKADKYRKSVTFSDAIIDIGSPNTTECSYEIGPIVDVGSLNGSYTKIK